jgi:hypothetical protein
LKIRGLIWNEDNLEHAARHGVNPEEVDEVLERYHQVVRVGKVRYAMRGQTWAGRYLVVFLDRKDEGWYFVVTAREMTVNEARSFRKWL